jgi:tRNA threonylcarbamoyl adenosine modification protein YeaZ
MTTLLLDTSTPYPFVALMGEENQVEIIKLSASPHLSKELMRAVKTLFQQAGIAVRDLKAIGVGTGPGFFTGTRAGVAFAKALAFSLKIPLFGFASLIPFCPPKFGRYATLINAKNDALFAVKGDFSPIGKQSEGTLEQIALANLPLALADCSILLPIGNLNQLLDNHLPPGKWERTEPSLDLDPLLYYIKNILTCPPHISYSDLSLTYPNF